MSAQTLYCQKQKSLHYIFAADSGGFRKHMYFETECKMVVEGHPRSLILVPIESLGQ